MITLLAQTGPELVTPATVETAPYIVTAFVAGIAAPIGVWSILFVATLVKRGVRLGGGGVTSSEG